MVTKDNHEQLGELICALSELGYIEKSGEIECVVIDSSTESTRIRDICNEYELIYRWQSPSGIYAAMNHGYENSSCRWLWFMNPGDNPVLSSEFLLHHLRSARNILFHAIMFKTRTVTADKKFIRFRNTEIIRNKLVRLYKTSYCHQGILYNRVNFDVGRRFDEEYKLISDKILNDDIVNRNSTLVINEILADFVVGGVSSNRYLVRKEVNNYFVKRILGLYYRTLNL